ncbi:cold-shock protein [Aeriscardovia aeriphila]|uniref:Cold shock domain-containing protein n=1 Tax=Aeriscardovia aeriphila TaxID=218139 RepID=A0A261FAY8_9BIFI|nr:cold shock domain-containing protein [Aeriscardovia aeriphila]MDO5694795.1 cold shock domain-containing protein [Aeriscardovia aeriphila]NYI25583.1 CspA family cold shock protein [Aeriscardovia aeriphila]OZG56268.1 cold-shock protein [Aeriscardovia aeriphila]HJF18168.1 cold shock domain-containing protein [Aeriscardovia aeriphila]
MPTGRVKWFDTDRGYGFVIDDNGKDVHLSKQALPAGVHTLKKGTRVEFSVVDSRKGPEVMDLKIVGTRQSIVAATRPNPEDMAAIVEDLINVLNKAGGELRRKHYPSEQESRQMAKLLRAVADNFDVPE